MAHKPTKVPVQLAARDFTRDDMMILPDSPEEPYRQRKDEEKKAIHDGQLKLALSEIQFFTHFWDPIAVPKPVAIYAGAAPGLHIPLIALLFPQIEFHLYDPKKFSIEPSEKIHIYQQYFTDNDARKWTGRKDVFFISDIRTVSYKTLSTEANEKAIIEDMRRQEMWYKEVSPVKALLKFRPPYAYDFIPPYFRYLAGYLFKQAFAPQTTTETRLVPYGTTEADYDVAKYGNQMFYHNTIIREQTQFNNPFTEDLTPIDPPELTNDFDSVLEAYILSEYMIKMSGAESATQENVVGLSRVIMNKLTEHQVEKVTVATLRQGPVKSTTQLAEIRREQKVKERRGGKTPTRTPTRTPTKKP